MRFLLLAFLLFPSVAYAQVGTGAGPGAPPFTKYKNTGGNFAGASGNGADLTEDTLTNCGFTIPINATPNVGDVFQVTLGGKFGATTDSKSLRVKHSSGAPVIFTASGTVAAAISWVAIIKFQKTGTNAQNIIVLSNVGNGTFNGATMLTGTFQETIANAFLVTGQNVTNSVANSVTCQYMQTEYFGAN